LSATFDAINDAFNALFFGAGAWFGILIVLSISLGLMLKWKYSGTLLLPVTIFMGIDYLTQDPAMPWHAIIMFSSSLVFMLYMVKQIK
jgi:hypothetical protein